MITLRSGQVNIFESIEEVKHFLMDYCIDQLSTITVAEAVNGLLNLTRDDLKYQRGDLSWVRVCRDWDNETDLGMAQLDLDRLIYG